MQHCTLSVIHLLCGPVCTAHIDALSSHTCPVGGNCLNFHPSIHPSIHPSSHSSSQPLCPPPPPPPPPRPLATNHNTITCPPPPKCAVKPCNTHKKDTLDSLYPFFLNSIKQYTLRGTRPYSVLFRYLLAKRVPNWPPTQRCTCAVAIGYATLNHFFWCTMCKIHTSKIIITK